MKNIVQYSKLLMFNDIVTSPYQIKCVYMLYRFNLDSYPFNDMKYVLRHIAKLLIVFRISAVSLIGIFGNTFNIGVLISTRKNSNFTPTFLKLLVLLSTFDLLYLLIVIGIFGLPALSPWYNDNIYIQILPTW